MMSMKIFPEQISTCVHRLNDEDTFSLELMAPSSTHGIGQPISDQNRGGQSSSWFRSLWVWPHYNTVFPEPLAQMQWTMGHFSLHNYVSQLCTINYFLSAYLSSVVYVSTYLDLCIDHPLTIYPSFALYISIFLSTCIYHLSDYLRVTCLLIQSLPLVCLPACLGIPD